MESGIGDRWVELEGGGEVHMDCGIPDRVAFSGRTPAGEALAEEIRALSGLHVKIGAWHAGEAEDEMEAEVTVKREDLEEVLRRLALASAELFYERYHKRIDSGDTDWDDEAFAQDFGTALQHCGMHWGEVKQAAYRDLYLRTAHEAAQQLVSRH